MKYIISEEQANKFKVDKWCKYIEDIVLSMKLKYLCGVQVMVIDNKVGDGKIIKNYLVILQSDYHNRDMENIVSQTINGYLPHLELIVIRLDCDTPVKITESNSLSKKFTNVVQNKGIVASLDIVGSYDDLVIIVGEGTITREIEENFIRDIVLEHGGISVHDLNEDPIVYKETDGEVWEIYYFGIRRVSINIWYDAGYGALNDALLSYENLSNKYIHEIFIMLVEHYIKGFNLP
jgi:hypothetical protein